MERKPCPKCGSIFFGSWMLDDGTLMRHCHGPGELGCRYKWHQSQDAEHFEVEPETERQSPPDRCLSDPADWRAAKQPAAGPWIPVEERLPEAGRSVLTIGESGTVRVLSMLHGGEWHDGVYMFNTPTRWAEIRRPR